MVFTILACPEEKISEIKSHIQGAAADEYDISGLIAVPGIVDLHVHVSSWLGGRLGHHMLALAGVTTALDMAGPIESVVELARDHGGRTQYRLYQLYPSGAHGGHHQPYQERVARASCKKSKRRGNRSQNCWAATSQ